MQKNPKNTIEKYLLHINTRCNHCGYRNIGKYELKEEVTIVCCGSCGETIVKPEELDDKTNKKIKDCVNNEIKSRKLHKHE